MLMLETENLGVDWFGPVPPLLTAPRVRVLPTCKEGLCWALLKDRIFKGIIELLLFGTRIRAYKVFTEISFSRLSLYVCLLKCGFVVVYSMVDV